MWTEGEHGYRNRLDQRLFSVRRSIVELWPGTVRLWPIVGNVHIVAVGLDDL